MENELLAKAIILATENHKGQLDKGGHPYILHPLRVMVNVKSLKAKIVAILHDIIEDTDITKEDLLTIELLSKSKKEDYIHYIRRIKGNPLAKEVKMADLQDNMDLTRLNKITEKDLNRVEKYKKAYSILNE